MPGFDNTATKLAKLEKIRRLNEEGLRFYEPNKAQLSFHQSQAETRGFWGGNQAGKSYGGAVEMLFAVGKVHPWRPNYKGMVYGRDCCVDFEVLHSVLLPTYKKLIPRRKCVLRGKTFEGKERVWPGLKGGSWETAYRSEEHTSELQSHSFISYAVFCLKKKK